MLSILFTQGLPLITLTAPSNMAETGVGPSPRTPLAGRARIMVIIISSPHSRDFRSSHRNSSGRFTSLGNGQYRHDGQAKPAVHSWPLASRHMTSRTFQSWRHQAVGITLFSSWQSALLGDASAADGTRPLALLPDDSAFHDFSQPPASRLAGRKIFMTSFSGWWHRTCVPRTLLHHVARLLQSRPSRPPEMRVVIAMSSAESCEPRQQRASADAKRLS